MFVIYCNQICVVGLQVEFFFSEKMFVIFGGKVFDEFCDFCYVLFEVILSGIIGVGDVFVIGEYCFFIIVIGVFVQCNFDFLGYVIFVFDGVDELWFEGVFYVCCGGELFRLQVGSIIFIELV